MGLFSKKKKTAEVSVDLVQNTGLEEQAYAIKTGAAFMLEKYDSILQEEVVIGEEIRRIQKKFGAVVADVASLSDIIATSQQSILQTTELAGKFQVVKDDIGNAVAEAKEEIGKLQESSNMTVASYEAMNKTFSALEQAVGDIKECMIGIIAIANQTNLLSLNASIEAARAGEAGRGFAIVAEQVRQLSDEIKTLTGNVERSIESVESSTIELNESIKTSKSAVEMSFANAESTYAIVDKVQESASGINEVYNELCESMEESRRGVQNIEEFVSVSQSSYDKVSSCINTINDHENKKGVMYEDLYNILQQYGSIADSIK